MTKAQFANVTKVANFHTRYCPKIINWQAKWRGYNTNRNAKEFTDADKIKIRAGIKRLQADLEKLSKSFS